MPPRPDTAAAAPRRRDFLLLAGASLALAGPVLAQDPPQTQAPVPTPFGPTTVADLARSLARVPYKAPPGDVPFKGLPFDQYVGIKAQRRAMAWEGEGLSFVVEPLHVGSLFTAPVQINLVEDGAVRRIDYDPAAFEFGALKAPEPNPQLGFSGFRVHAAVPGGGGLFDAATFQGASFFRAHAHGQGYGPTSRCLALWPAESRGEEFPVFRVFWIERPAPGADSLVIHALVDSESATAAMRFLLRPGDLTLIDVEGTLFPRVALDHVGLACMSAAHFFGSNDRPAFEDLRVAAHAVGGLRVMTGRGEALWRPVQNPQALQVSVFADNDPKGFGLLQRERDFAAFQDDVQRWERRPSLWVEPTKPFGPGAVHLIEVPSQSEVNENVIAYWRCEPVPAGAERGFGYRQFWCWTPPNQPELAASGNARSARVNGSRRRSFSVDFTGKGLFEGGAEIRPALSAAGGKVVRSRLFQYPDRATVRVLFEVEPEGDKAPELRLVLHNGDKAVSETWLYR